MEKRKSITIWNWRLSITIALCSLSIFIAGFSTEHPVKSPKDSLQALVDILFDEYLDEISLKELERNTIYIFNSAKTCIPCYKDIEQFIIQNNEDYKINVILIMEENILAIDQQMAMINQYFNVPKEFYFLFYPTVSNKDNKIINYYHNTPSPFLFLIDNDHNLEFYSLDSLVK